MSTQLHPLPIRPEDEPAMVKFHETLSERSVYLRYFHLMNLSQRTSHERLTRICFIDYDREMALVGTLTGDEGKEVQIGVARYVVNPDGESVEFALAVSDAWQKSGVGRKLMTALIDCARQKGYRAVVGDVLSTNGKMFNLMTSLGFTIHPHPDDVAVKRVIKPLTG